MEHQCACVLLLLALYQIHWPAAAAKAGLSRNKCWGTEVHVHTLQTQCGTKLQHKDTQRGMNMLLCMVKIP